MDYLQVLVLTSQPFAQSEFFTHDEPARPVVHVKSKSEQKGASGEQSLLKLHASPTPPTEHLPTAQNGASAEQSPSQLHESPSSPGEQAPNAQNWAAGEQSRSISQGSHLLPSEQAPSEQYGAD
jgi:hypothetical protein